MTSGVGTTAKRNSFRASSLPLVLSISLLTFSSLSPTHEAQATNVSGSITDTLWTLAGSPYLLIGSAAVQGHELKIQPGVSILNTGSYSLAVNSNGVLYADGVAFSNVPLSISNNGSRVSQLTNCTFVGAGNQGIGLLVDADSALVTNCQFSGFDYGIITERDSRVVISGVTVTGGSYGLSFGDAARPVVNGTTISGCTYPLRYAGACQPTYGGGNNFSGNTNSAIAVSESSGSTNATWGTEAFADYRVLTWFGMYEGQLTLLPGVKWHGLLYVGRTTGNSHARLVATGVEFTPGTTQLSPVQIYNNGDQVSQLTNCTFVGAGNQGIGLSINSDSVLITNCQFSGLANGIVANQGARPVISGVTVTGGSYGLSFGDAARPVVSGTTVSGCTYPLQYTGACQPTYAGGNNFTGNTNSAIAVSESSGSTNATWGTEVFADYRVLTWFGMVQGQLTLLPGVKWHGLLYVGTPGGSSHARLVATGVEFSPSTTQLSPVQIYNNNDQVSQLTNCTFVGAGNQGIGLGISTDSALVTNCQFSGFEYGMQLDEGARVAVETSSFVNCRKSVQVNASSTNASLRITQSSFDSDSIAALVNADPDFTVMAEYNWWGHSSGPRHPLNPGGLGDSVYGKVDFIPWLTRPPNLRGGLQGHVTEINSSLPLPGAIVKTTFGFSDTTDQDGYYRIALIPPGYGYDCWAYAGGFVPDTVRNLSINDSIPTLVDFQLKVSNVNSFVVRDLHPNPNPPVSTIGVGGTLHRYYWLRDSNTDQPVAGAYLILPSADSFQTNEWGVADIRILSVDVGSGVPGASWSFEISEVSYAGIRFSLGSPVNFQAQVENREYSTGWESSTYGKLGISYLRFSMGRGSVIELLENDNLNASYDAVRVVRQNRDEVGAGWDVGSPVNIGVSGVGGVKAEAGAEAFGAAHKEDEYVFPYPAYSQIDALNMYVLFADGNMKLVFPRFR